MALRYAVLALSLVTLAGCGGTGGGARDVSAHQTTPATAQAASWWRPKVGVSWQWQLSGKIDTSVQASVYDIDMFETPKSTVTALHGKGRKVICYVSAGSVEQGRPDYTSFPKSVIGKKLDGWPKERWLDIRRLDVLQKIWAKRLDQCKAKGFDGVEPDNVDAYQADSGFPLTAKQQLAFNRMLARVAHQKGLAVGLKNDLDQIPSLVKDFDFAVNEQCAEYKECSTLKPFIAAGKPVFHAEYNLPLSRFCPESKRLRLSSIKKTLDLTAKRQTCP
ncbi:endo alpha-1,4 polygalactosaminidase [Actinoallomurus rhizosphaericola]|uniref:endo alpha-1,4 polygalactosaminidase n=1 Tax=Actinoallomurus rhizosphaericola TaxID=2952536 RepID=UPI002093A0E7|nr:endo alpha-1,4 polygalactosaminidase [Actinoallomurus rhizosphaericola]MCO5997561.1 endo alpha-1,4 polygalactosaminidase [Actinoallomurus rhizosphaericola]